MSVDVMRSKKIIGTLETTKDITEKGSKLEDKYSQVSHNHSLADMTDGVSGISVKTQAEYDAIGVEKDTNNILYIIVG